MRTGIIVLGASLALTLMEGAGWLVSRFSAFWWTVQTVQITAVLVAFVLIIKRVARLEEEVKSLRTRVNAIRDFCARSLGFQGEGSSGGEGDERVLRSVS